jgi:DNA helicase-2/ATP-dependent DNA helicase PcrA
MSIAELLPSLNGFMGYSSEQLVKFAQVLYALLGFTLTNDVLLVLINRVKERLVIAIAGGGKTTFSQIDIVFLKILWLHSTGNNLIKAQVLCLVYNKENVRPMEVKHQYLVSIVNQSGFMNRTLSDGKVVHRVLDDGVTAYTLHAWCLNWIHEYSSYFNLKREGLLTNDSDLVSLNSAIIVFKKSHPDVVSSIDAKSVMSLYNLARENFYTVEDILNDNEKLHDRIVECEIEPRYIVDIINLYEKLKRMKGSFDFTDCLVLVDSYLKKENSPLRERLRQMYRYVVVDEIQDFSPLMISIVKNVVGDNTSLLAVGDEDQSIYAFRGADSDLMLNFQDIFPYSEIFNLIRNRRCKAKVLDAARKIIEENVFRFDKQLLPCNLGGNFQMIGYSREPEQMDKLLSLVRGMSDTDKNSTVISFRDRVYCAPISKALFDAGIDYHILSGVEFCRTEIFTDFISVLNLVNNPTKVEFFQYIYKILNVRRDDWLTHINYDSRINKCKSFPDIVCYWDIDMSPFEKYRGFMDNLKWIQSLSLGKDKIAVSSYYDELFRLFKNNFWINKSGYLQNVYTVESEDWLRSIFCKSEVFEAVMSNFLVRTKYRVTSASRSGVTLGTFHSLKGLEFENQIMTFMNDDIFPNYDSINLKPYTEIYKQQQREGENRLCYVAMTRPRTNLTMLYYVNNPSYYIKVLKGNTGGDGDKSGFERFDFVFSSRRKL